MWVEMQALRTFRGEPSSVRTNSVHRDAIAEQLSLRKLVADTLIGQVTEYENVKSKATNPSQVTPSRNLTAYAEPPLNIFLVPWWSMEIGSCVVPRPGRDSGQPCAPKKISKAPWRFCARRLDIVSIDNPFLTFDDTRVEARTGRTELEEYVWQFVVQADLKDKFELLRFGARLARDKHEAMSRYADELTEPEKKLLEKEKEKETGFWKQSKFFRATIITASLGGMIQGWTQSVNNGTAYGMPDEFGLCYRSANCSAAQLWTFGMLNAIPLLSAGIFGTIAADPLQEIVLGRRGSVMLSCAITIASTIGASVTQNVGQLAACRAINGIALGAKASIIPIYSAELSPEHIRGAILANWQLADAAGIFFGFLANLLVVIYVGDPFRSWRILTNTVLVPTVPLLIMIYLMPESPRYLVKHGKYRKALQAFEQIQTTWLLCSRDFMYAHAQLDFESRLLKGHANEYGNLAERIDVSTQGSLGALPGPLPHGPQPQSNASDTSISQGRSIDSVEPIPDISSLSVSRIAQPRDSHQQSSQQDEQSRERSIELVVLNRSTSELSSLNIDLGIQRAKKRDNPYSYHIGVTGYFNRLVQLWENKRCRRALLSASTAMISQQMTGVNTSTIVWENSLVNTDSQTHVKSDARTAAIIGLAFGAANYVFGLPAYWLSDKIGRSIMLALGLPNMAWSMLVFAFLFKIPNESVRVPLVSIFAIVFVVFYAPTAGTSPFSISAEVFPLVSREAGMAVSVAVNLLGAGVLVLVFPFLLHQIGATGALSIFAGLNMIAFVLVYLFVPETRMRTLEELQYTFDLPTRWHISYRAGYIRKHVVQNWWKYLTGKSKEVEPPIPFYEWARVVHGEREDAS
ncbi:MFS general substrate transporter [Cucurbitaria berberidis CBS 394.84]|uniref:MFS general substrate transporter n=1 Tax=Cucurbitaria berberidis CBS 394.84 TaxID=1168544 RepID=A0A9P4GNB2_9PLEO|nr:MFS general substrate transporter [Cucurbitaria berberidis CBS 394.84]KAF1848807.1 MFS general substrate transporter [Cucurbitaria berberidis CBS 394.84]